MKRTFFIPLIGTPIYGIRDMGIDVPFTVQFLGGAYKKNDKNWRLNQRQTCPVILKDQLKTQDIGKIKQMDMIFGVPPCRFLSMLNVKHDNFATGNSQQCMMDIAKQAAKYNPPVFCFQNAPRLSSAKPAMQWALPTLIQTMKPYGYKFTLYKTTTKNHGLPQKRQRTFFIAYKGQHSQFDVYKFKNNPVTVNDLISDLNDQQDNQPYKNPAANKLQQWLRKGNQTVTSFQSVDSWFYWKELLKYSIAGRPLMWSILSDPNKNKWKEMISQVKNQKDNKKLNDIFEYAFKKIAMGKGIWDASPILRDGNSQVCAIISKNAYRLVHPSKQRLLTLRELSRFMGIPDRFTFHEKSRAASLHYITQNVPSFTYANVRDECKKYVNGTGNKLKSYRDLIFIDNLSDDDKDLYYEYSTDEIKNCVKGLGKDKKPFFQNDSYAKSFIQKINQ